MQMPPSEVQIGIRVSEWLKKDLAECAERSGWTLSDQIRFELEERRGKARMPYLPQPPPTQLDFNAPTHKAPVRTARRRR